MITQQSRLNPGSDRFILTINGGSSSLKFALFQAGDTPVRLFSGMFERIGFPEGILTLNDVAGGTTERRTIHVPDHEACLDPLKRWLEERIRIDDILAIGHRVVHGGMTYSGPGRVTPHMLEELRRISLYDPEHLPSEIDLIDAFSKRYPNLAQIACFDTAFHRDMPRVARLLPIPRRFDKLGVQRYGFHGLSYAFLMKELARVGGRGEANGRIILAHLGNGASMAAVKGGKSVDTTMGFTPTSGMPMSRRSGDLDPGLVSYLARTEGMSVDRFHKMINTESGLLGVSEISSDLRDLLAQEQSDSRAAEAVALFCYQVRKWIGAMSAAMGGLDTLVFSAGIGENSSVIRARICDGLEFLGIIIDDARNETGNAVISKEGSSVTVRVIHTDEESEIAYQTAQCLQGSAD